MPIYFETATIYYFSTAILIAAVLLLSILFFSRTAELKSTIRSLDDKIQTYEQAKEALTQAQVNLVDRIAGQTQELAALFEVMILSGQSLAINDLLERSLIEIMAIVGAAATCIHTIGERANGLQLMVQQGLSAVEQNAIQTLPQSWLPPDKLPHLITNFDAADLPPVAIPGRAAYLGMPITLQHETVGLLSFYWHHPRTFSVEDLAFFSILASQLGITMENTRLRKLNEEAAIIQERQRLARDLHDSVNQSLHSLVLFSDTANAVLQQNKPDRLKYCLAQLTESARQALKEMRLLLSELHPTISMNDDLTALLTTRLNRVERRAGINAQLTIDHEVNWPQDWNEQIYFITTEALNNSLRHARAHNLYISLCSHQRDLELKITDDGCGFDPERDSSGGMGLKNMAKRAEQLGGHLAIESQPGRGTTVRLQINDFPDDLNSNSQHE